MAVPSEPARTGCCDRLARERVPVCSRKPSIQWTWTAFWAPARAVSLFFLLSQGPVEGFPRHCPSPSHALSDERIGAAIGQRQRLLGQSEDLPCRITRGDSPSRRPSIWQPLQNRRWGFSLCISTCASTATRRWLCPGSATAPTRNPMRGRCAVLASSPSWASSASPRTKSYRRPIVLS